MYYLGGNGEDFTFKHEKIHKIDVEDVLLSNEIYQRFFKEQEKGRQFIVKNINGQTFEEIFEELM